MPLRPLLLLLCLCALLGASVASAGDDKRAPQSVSSLSVEHATRTTLSVEWDAGRDAKKKAVTYDVFLNGTKVDRTSETKAKLRGLRCDTPYTIGVRGRDAAG